MNVHLITREHQSDRILGRLGRCLSEQTGWTLGATPRGNAELNHWLCYIEYAEDSFGWHDTPISAYFTHYDAKTPAKAAWWEQAAREVDLRIVTAPMYLDQLSAHGKTVLVKPPIDQGKFVIAERQTNAKPVVGLSGFVDKASGRKGENLVAQLAKSELGKQIELKAMGRGWPVPTTYTGDPDHLPSFYQSLDVFLCTSYVEGNPLPPLEALACGIPVVIPRGVGMLDELPDIEGIYRYEAGNVGQMCEILREACAKGHQIAREPLREATAPYTPQAWAEGHTKAFEGLVCDLPFFPPLNGPRGMYCVAYGKPARSCANKLIETFQSHMPAVPVAIASTEPLGPETHFIDFPDMDIGARAAKVKMYENAPQDWEFVLYLDADIEIKADIGFLYEVLKDGWELVICKNPGKFHSTRKMYRPDNREEVDTTFAVTRCDELIQLNGGVLGFRRNDRVRRFFEAWYREWQRWGKRDQAALLRALWEVPLRIYVLSNAWNTVLQYDDASISAGILHYPMNARRWQGVVHHRSDSEEAWRKVRQYEAKI